MIKFKDFTIEPIFSKKMLKDIELQFEVDLQIYKNNFPYGYLVYKDNKSIAIISKSSIIPIGLAYSLTDEDILNIQFFQNEIIANELKYIKSIIIKLLEDRPFLFVKLPHEYRDDKEISLKAIEMENSNINEVSNRLKYDYDFAYKAVQLGCSLQYLPFDSDEKIALISIKNEPETFLMLDDNLRNDKKFVDLAMDLNPKIYEYLPNKFKQNESYAYKALSEDGNLFSVLPFKLKCNKKLALKALNTDLNAYEYFCEELKNDEDIQYQYENKLKEIHKNINKSFL